MTLQTDCYKCVYRQRIPGDCHSSCNKPAENQFGANGGACSHAINHGWYWYPINFDPIWRQNECPNFESTDKPAEAPND